MSLFDGVQNFTPAFTGQQIANQTGQGAGQSISRGMGVKNQGKATELRGKELDLYKDKFQHQKTQDAANPKKFNFTPQQLNDIDTLMEQIQNSGGGFF